MANSHVGAALEVDDELIIPDDGLTLLADDALLDLVRGGSADAYGVLFERYRHPAHRLAGYFSNSVDAKDIVAETFADVLHQLRRGKGPHTSFRSYLFTSVRREAGKRARLHKRVRVTSDEATIDKPVPFGGGGCDTFERELVRAAFASLPTRWRTVLWQLDVDGRKPHELASHLGLKPNAVSALAYRAREGLRRAYLEQHVLTDGTSLAVACKEVRTRLVTFVRGSATTRDVIMIDPHLDTCVACMDVYLELEEVNTHLGAVSTALAIGFAAPAAAPLVGSVVAKSSFLAKLIAGPLGSTAAAVATSVTVVTVPMVAPVQATTVHVRPFAMAQEPDRRIGPAADGPGSEKQTEKASNIDASSAATDTVSPGDLGTTGPETSAPTPSPDGVPTVTVHVDKTDTSASVSTPGIEAAVSINLQKPEATQITVKVAERVVKLNADTLKDLAAGAVEK